MAKQLMRLNVQYFQFDIGKQWWLLSVSMLNVSLSPCQPIQIILFLSVSFTVWVCVFVYMSVWDRLFRCRVCAWQRNTRTCTHRHTDSSTDTITQVHRGRNAIIVASGNVKWGMPASQPLTLTHTHTHSPVCELSCQMLYKPPSSNQSVCVFVCVASKHI